MTSDSRPNLLFILTDQQRADALGAVSPWLKTPALDRLAREGVRFSRCYTQSPGCIPARVSLMTGLYPHNTHVWNARPFTLPATARTWVRQIQSAGYRTSLVGKTHLHPQHGDLRDRQDLVASWGFEDVTEIAGPRGSAYARSEMTDEWEGHGLWDAFRADLEWRSGANRFAVGPSPLGLDHHYDTFVARKALERIRGYGHDRPWFCYVAFGGPHEPWDAPEPYDTLYGPDDLPEPLPQIESLAPSRPRGALLDERLFEDERRLAPVSRAALDALRANYAGKVTMIDRFVGDLVAAVEERGELERTVVAFASDHGEMNGDHGLIHKSCFLEPAVLVPLLIRPAGDVGRRGAVADSPVELIDVGATLADAAGAPLDYAQWGRSLWPILSSEAVAVREFAVSEQRGELMLAHAHWKVALNRDGAAYLCTNVTDDVGERANVAGTAAAASIEDTGRERALRFLLATQLLDDWS